MVEVELLMKFQILRELLQQMDPAQIEKLIRTNNIAALIKTDQAGWEACLIKTGPSSYVMDEYGLPKQSGVKQPDWVYKRRQFLKSLSVADRNFILTGDPAFSFDPVPYTIVYDFSYADAVRGLTHRVVPPVQAPPPAPQVQVPQVPTQAAPAQLPPVQIPQVLTPTVPAQTPRVQVPQVQEAQEPAPTTIAEPQKQLTVGQPESEPDISDLPLLEDDSNPTSPSPQQIQYQPQVPDKL